MARKATKTVILTAAQKAVATKRAAGTLSAIALRAHATRRKNAAAAARKAKAPTQPKPVKKLLLTARNKMGRKRV
jgi:hypothetical protein